jgi:murein DD-endopeptidase MepM/ murein hydrolase activator NlpD
MSIPPVTFSIEPEENGKLVYLPVAAPTKNDEASSMVAFRLLIENDDTEKGKQLNKIQVSFLGQPNLTKEFNRDESFEAGATRTIYLTPEESIQLSANPPNTIRIGIFFDGYSDPKVIERTLAAHHSPTPQNSYRFPGNAMDMELDQYFTQKARHTGGSQHFGYDIGVQGWNPVEKKFTGTKPNTDGTQNDHHLIWKKPIYAMADGIVIRARTGWEDNPAPGKRAVTRMGENQAGNVGNLAVTRLSGERVASVVQTAQDRLKIIIWDVSNFAKTVTRKGDAEGEAINLLAADALTNSRLVTAVRTTNGNLKVIVWSVSADGKNVMQLSEHEAGAVKAISLIKLTETRFATAVRTSEDNLRLIIWEVSTDGSSISRLDHESAGAITDVSLARLSSTRLATAVRIASGELKVIIWTISADGKITRGGDKTAEAITSVASATFSESRLATCVRTDTGNLNVTVWKISDDGKIVTQGATMDAGAIQSVSAVKTVGSTVSTTVVTQAGNFKLIVWNYDADDDKLVRWGENVGGAATLTAIDELSDGYMATGVRTGSGQLKIITWFLGSGGGNSLLILHGDELVLYAHMRNGSVDPAVAEVGATVKSGQFLGRAGNSGSSSGPHLHIHAVQAPTGMTPQQMIEADEKDALDGLVYRPLPFHNAQAMRLADVKHNNQNNPFAVLNNQGVYFEKMAIWPGLTTPGIPV